MKKLSILLLFALFFAKTYSQTAGTLTVSFKTSTYGGQYASKHILAVWVDNSSTNSSSTYIKTLNSYYQNSQYRQYLSKWKTATGSTYNTTDAVTGATLSSHGTVSGKWNATNTLSATVADGTYYVFVEFTEANSSGPYAVISFTKGASATTTFTTVTSSTYITNFTLTWTPTASAIEESTAGKNYQVYPNPVKDYLTVTGSEITKLNLYSPQGRLLTNTTENTLDFNSYPKGAYVVEIISKEGTFYRKVLKK